MRPLDTYVKVTRLYQVIEITRGCLLKRTYGGGSMNIINGKMNLTNYLFHVKDRFVV